MGRGRARRQSSHHGILVLDKPTGFTSQDAVNVVRRVAGTRRVGHTGTLDPIATGVLVILVGEATKLSEHLVGLGKEYEGVLRLGARSNTYDAEGEIEELPDAPRPPLDRLRALAAQWTGPIDQVPPPYSAVKIDGKKLYEYARKGEAVEAAPRPVTVDAYEITSMDSDLCRFRVACSSGTYVRSLVHELGEAAGCGALVQELRRTCVGDIRIDEAVTLDQLREAGPEGFSQFLLPMIDALTDWPIYHVGDNAAGWIRRGQAIPMALARLDEESQAKGVGTRAFLVHEGEDAFAIAVVRHAPPGKPPADLARHVGAWLQPEKLLLPSPE